MAVRPRRNEPSQRQLRVGELVRHALSDLLSRGQIHDDVLANQIVTIAEVRLSPDLRQATAYVAALGSQDVTQVLDALHRHRKFIRGHVARAVKLKFAPDVRFEADTTLDEARRIDELLDSATVRQDVSRDHREG